MRRTALAAALLASTACIHADVEATREASAPLRFPTPFHVIAHRGASGYAPENTLPAFRRALELGAFEVELDVQLSSDDAVVIFHDQTLDEKTDRRGRVRDHTAALLRATDIGTWFDRTHPGVSRSFAGTTLVTLSELFESFGAELYYHVEIKTPEPELPQRVLEAIRTYDLGQRATITSFSMEQLLRVRGADRDIPICLLVPPTGDASSQRAAVDAAVVLGADQVGIFSRELTPELVAYGHARGLSVRAWGVYETADMDRAIDTGTNGMTIDWPDRLIARLVRHEAQR